MFLLHCTTCGRRELRGPRSLFTDDAGEFVATCRACGTTELVLPRVDRVPAPAEPAPAPAVLADRGLVPSAA